MQQNFYLPCLMRECNLLKCLPHFATFLSNPNPMWDLNSRPRHLTTEPARRPRLATFLNRTSLTFPLRDEVDIRDTATWQPLPLLPAVLCSCLCKAPLPLWCLSSTVVPTSNLLFMVCSLCERRCQSWLRRWTESKTPEGLPGDSLNVHALQTLSDHVRHLGSFHPPSPLGFSNSS